MTFIKMKIMQLRKITALILVLILNLLHVNAQTGDYASQWKKIADYESKGLTKNALDETVKIFSDAVKMGNEPQQIKAAMYQMKYRNMTEEDNAQKNIFFADTLIAKLKSPSKNILQSMQAQLLETYRNNNRYKLYNRTATTDENGKDISTWSLAKLNATIASLYKASLQNDNLLKATSLKGYDAVIEKGKNTESLRPTLYDLLAHRALDFFMSTENDVTQASYKFIINDETAFAPVGTFVNHPFISKDTASLYLNALSIMQGLLKFHMNDAQPDALIDADLKRLDFVNDHGVFNNKAVLYEAALQNIETKYSSSPASAQAFYLHALIYSERGNTYDPATKPAPQFDLVKAKRICEEAYAKFPKSEGSINCKNLSNGIEQPSLTFQIEKVNLTAQPFRSFVEYKNTQKVYFRIVKTNHDQIKALESVEYDKVWPGILKLSPLKSWSVDVPDQKDYQQHSTEVKIDALPQGTYYVLASLREDFSLGNNIIGRTTTYVSNISYIINNKNELYALDRDNGQPLANAAVQLWKNTYNYTTRKNEEVKAAAYTSDKNGFVKIVASTNYENNTIQIRYNGDELFTDNGINTYYYNYYDQQRKAAKRTFIFTDRSIYRPGQTVFFKGIMTATDTTGRKSEIIAGRKTAIQLFDNNNQKISSVNVKSNEFGSYNGSFKIPEGLLNGNFYLQDTLTKSTQYFSVEEYKRPKFSAEIKKPEGSYRVNDSIKVTGSAKAYAGNNIDGAKVSYRVVRVVRYPIWYGYYRSIWPPRGGNEEMEITNGEATTDANGAFNITFKAIPDEAVDKKSQPTFDYRVTADVTDINGETRSATQTVSVSYQALQLNITGDDKLPADSLKNIGVSSTNANGSHEKATVNFAMYKLQEPGRIFRARYWEMPDQHTMTKEEYYRSFPYDAYADEDQMAKWSLGEKVIDKTDTTASNSLFVIGRSSLPAGWYKIVVTTKDKFGEDVKAEKFIQVTTGGKERITQPILVTTENDTAEPGGKITYNINTGFDKVWLIQNIIRPDEKYKITYPTVSAGEPLTNTIDVNESDRGGINMNYAFVQHNRIYTGGESFAILWSNKDLKIAYETFRDKLQPGSEEKWKIKITGAKAEKVAAEALISMYDASLDQFKPHEWGSLSGLWPGVYSSVSWTGSTFSTLRSNDNNNLLTNYLQQNAKVYASLINTGWNYVTNDFNYYRGDTYRIKDKNISAARAAAPMVNQVQLASPIEKEGAELSMPIYDSTGAILGTADKVNDSKVDVANNITIRKNFNETAFFFPDLKTDESGNVEFSFTMPEALTQWKLMVMAHTKELASAYSSKTTVTQKELMVQPNAPRFLREGDRMEFSAKIVNLTDKEITGTSQLELLNAATNKPVDGWFKNVFPNQYFTVPAGQSIAVKFPMDVPFNFNSAMMYRIKAISKDGSFSDGEEMALPVLTNRTLVTETMPLNMRNTNSKTFKFDKLLTSGNSGSLTNHALTVEYTSNPAWYAVQALPYLMEYPYECAEQSFNRYYANVLASYISNSSPKIKEVFEKWKITDTAALMSNLQKNEELKSVLLQETPWVLNAQSEAQQKKNIALLFDMVKLAGEKSKTLAKLKDMQSSNGGFAWFKGGADDRYMTQYVITGIGHLRKLGALQGDDYAAIKPIVDKALPYLDARLKDEYDNLVRYKADLTKNNLSSTAIQYLYMRSFFPENKIAAASGKAVDYYKGQSVKYWLSQSKYMQAMIALAAGRSNDDKTAKAVIASLKQNAITNEEMGMYWKDFTKGGYYWYQAPIESQAMMIEAFTDIDKNTATVNDLKTWLLKQKQTQQWPTTKATAEACYALLLGPLTSKGGELQPLILLQENNVEIRLGNTIINSNNEKAEAGTGYFKKTIKGDKVQQGMGNITVSVKSGAEPPLGVGGTTWGGVYWQYFEDLDKITASETPLKLVKKLFIERNSDKGPVLEPVKDGDALKVGDKIKVRIELRADRDMEYVHMKDMRAACMEPTNVISQYKYQGGLGYYESTKDASTNFFFGWLPKGTYVFEYPMFVTLNGNFSNGITTIQCMYAPEFTSHSEGVRVSVGE
jgi:uncharacterized protein YfaS (alpha-2-macroglobulin family)